LPILKYWGPWVIGENQGLAEGIYSHFFKENQLSHRFWQDYIRCTIFRQDIEALKENSKGWEGSPEDRFKGFIHTGF